MDTLDPFCSCRSNSIETTEHYLLQCPNHSAYRSTLFDNFHNMNLMFLPFNVSTLSKILLIGYLIFNVDDNQGILRVIITFILSTRRFDESLFDESYLRTKINVSYTFCIYSSIPGDIMFIMPCGEYCLFVFVTFFVSL